MVKESLSLIEIEGAQRPVDIMIVFNVSKRRSRHLLNIFLTVIVRRTYDAGNVLCVPLGHRYQHEFHTNFTSRWSLLFYLCTKPNDTLSFRHLLGNCKGLEYYNGAILKEVALPRCILPLKYGREYLRLLVQTEVQQKVLMCCRRVCAFNFSSWSSELITSWSV